MAQKLGPGGSRAFMQELAAVVAGSLDDPPRPSDPAPSRLRKVTAMMNGLGYRAALKPGGKGRASVIEAVNRVYHSVAKQHPELCQFDVSLVEHASGMDVKLESCIAKGGASCRFCIKKKRDG